MITKKSDKAVLAGLGAAPVQYRKNREHMHPVAWTLTSLDAATESKLHLTVVWSSTSPAPSSERWAAHLAAAETRLVLQESRWASAG